MVELAGARASLLASQVLGKPVKIRSSPAARPEAPRHLGSLRTVAVAMVGTGLAFCRSRPLGVAASAGVVAVRAGAREVRSGDEIYVKYEGQLAEDGTVFDSSEGKEPLCFTVGSGQVVPGFDKAVRGLKVGEKKTVTIAPEDAYGQRSDAMIMNIPAEQVPKGLEEGMQVLLGGPSQKIPAQGVLDDGSAMLDMNHPLAGKDLKFSIELVGFREVVKGMDVVGWNGKVVKVPFAIANSPVSEVLKEPKWPEKWPYTAADFRRQDESDDQGFYNAPRFVTHIDNDAIESIRNLYALQFAEAPQGEYSVLDICSSWISHYPEDLKAKRVAITGMVEEELGANKQATEYKVADLNKNPKLPYDDNQFDFVTNVVSVDYLVRPTEVFQEMHRVLKPGGVAIMSFSNRCFFTKAIAMWVADMSDGPGHCQIVGNYFHFNPAGGWKDITSLDISKTPQSNPMWVVTAVKA
ncbi:unnamed protein product [Durusdinium trenchii]|uniref:peptidylprolyl isomerase n=2 Tax=Durusdinium trenchii TaxID=1381693 RepID=A0ABP0QYH4_9DINO